YFFFSSRRRHTRCLSDWSSDVCSSDLKELLYSHAEIAKFRRDRGAIDQRRTLRNTRITTFGRDFGTANAEYVPHGSDRVGRQSRSEERRVGKECGSRWAA